MAKFDGTVIDYVRACGQEWSATIVPCTKGQLEQISTLGTAPPSAQLNFFGSASINSLETLSTTVNGCALGIGVASLARLREFFELDLTEEQRVNLQRNVLFLNWEIDQAIVQRIGQTCTEPKPKGFVPIIIIKDN